MLTALQLDSVLSAIKIKLTAFVEPSSYYFTGSILNLSNSYSTDIVFLALATKNKSTLF